MDKVKGYFEEKHATPRLQDSSKSESVIPTLNDDTISNGFQDLSAGISSNSNNSSCDYTMTSPPIGVDAPSFTNSNLVTSPLSTLNDLNVISWESSTSTDNGCYDDGEYKLLAVNRSPSHGRGGRMTEVAHQQQHQWNIAQQQEQQQYSVDSEPQTASMNTNYGPSASAAPLFSSAENTLLKQPVQSINRSSSISSCGSGPGGENTLFDSLSNQSYSLEPFRSTLATYQGQGYIQVHGSVTSTLVNREYQWEETEGEGGGAEGSADLDPGSARGAAAINTALHRSQSARHMTSHNHAITMPEIPQMRTGIAQPTPPPRLYRTNPIQNQFDEKLLAERIAFKREIDKEIEENNRELQQAFHAHLQKELRLKKRMLDFQKKQESERESFMRYVLAPEVDHDFNATLKRLGGTYGERDTLYNDLVGDSATLQATATAARRRRNAQDSADISESESREPVENYDNQTTSKKDEY